MRTRTFAARRSFRAVATAIVLATAVVLPLTPLAPSAASASATSAAPQPVPSPEPTATPEPAVTPAATEAPAAPGAVPVPTSSAAPSAVPAPPATATSAAPVPSPGPVAAAIPAQPQGRSEATTTGAVAPMAIGAPEPGVEVPYLSWDVAPSAAGATFEIEWQQRSRWFFGWLSWSAWGNTVIVSDCNAGACTPTSDLDPDAGEFQITHVGSGHRIQTNTSSTQYQYRIRPLNAPSGYEWTDTAWRTSTQADRSGNVHNLGTFELGVNQPAACIGGAFYATTASGAVLRVSRDGVAPTTFGQFVGVPSNAQVNGLGIGLGGTVMFAAERPSGSANGAQAFHRYSVARGWERFPVALTAANVNVVTGAVSLADGRFYFGGFRTVSGTTRFELHSYDHSTRTTQERGWVAVTSSDSSNGDIAFNLNGDLFIAQNTSSGTRIYTVSASALAAGGAMVATASPSFSGVSGVNGIAFADDGTVFIGNGTTVRLYDPSTSSLRTGSVTTALVGSSDLASCASPATLTVRKHVVGRVASSDQFTLSMLRGSSVIGAATTSGSAIGLQATQLGPLTALAGQTYSIQESISANAGSYASSYACVDDRGITIASGSSRSGVVTMPARSGADVVCTFRNSPLVTAVSVQKLVESSVDGSRAPASNWAVTARTIASGGTVTSTPSAETQLTDSDGVARWSLRYGSTSAVATVAVSETQQQGFEFIEGACRIESIAGSVQELPLQGGGPTTVSGIAAGSTVECTYVNRELPTTLTLANTIGFGDAGLASQWQLRGTGPQSALPGPAGATGTASATARVTPSVAYALSHSGGPASYAQVGSWACRDQSGAIVPVTTSGVSLVKGTQVTCTVTNSTARLTLLKHIDPTAGGTLRADMFTLTATPASLAGLAATSTRGSETEIASGADANRFDVRPGHSYTLTERSDYASLGLRLERQTGPDTWATVTNPTVQIPAGEHHVYRFVNAPVPALALPLTGGIGANTYVMGGGALLLLALAFVAFRSRRAAQQAHRPLESPIKTPSIELLLARIQKGTAAMASTKKGLTARIAAGFGAAAIATVTILGGAFPASAAPGNIQPPTDEPRSLTIHKFAQPENAAPLPNDGREIEQADIDALNLRPLSGVEFTVTRVPGVELTTNAGWEAADAMTVDEAQTAIDTSASPVDSRADDTVNGVVTFSNLPDGLYLVTETDLGDNGIAIPAQPFLVTLPLPVADKWVYDVHIYPKNSTGDIQKRVVEGDAAVLGDVINWQIDSFVPYTPVAGQITSYTIVDTLDPRLEYVPTPAAEVRLGALAELDSAMPLTYGTDYTVDYDTTTRAVTLTLADALANDADGDTLRISYATRVVAVGDGAISNTATAFVNGYRVASSTDSTYWGTLRVIKHAGTDRSARLDGARFELRSVNDGAPVAADPATVVAVGTAGTNGEITFEGVITGEAGTTYYLVETEAPVGYERAASAQAVPISYGQPVDGVQNFVYFSNDQIAAYALPVTGGSGQAAFMIGGAGLILGGLGFVLLRRRKTQAQNQA
ncbi:SpaH/EbpB family LPXTG-anchored major pilin [Agrococcus sp. TF02-05]|uniref:SpaH/EbpB family LPXTG-anchored major pilin n=1 Tax=Agrococcus sp. TF02-05 TaxID=2815211 RepID=UPI001AA0D93D|nr:SpaH/EbpB family LPXTG-anchored major pilin [Agrococcus sp. TF02-05]MBO1769969.1 SpaH/EbpB family LPXTG-anchored major pilin [Agrococcus sp. TF02-05]